MGYLNFNWRDKDLLMLKYLAESHGHFLLKSEIKNNFYPTMSAGGFRKRLAKYCNKGVLKRYNKPISNGSLYTLEKDAYKVLELFYKELKKACNQWCENVAFNSNIITVKELDSNMFEHHIDYYTSKVLSRSQKYFEPEQYYRFNPYTPNQYHHNNRLNKIRFLIEGFMGYDSMIPRLEINNYFTEKMVRRYFKPNIKKLKGIIPDALILNYNEKLLALEYEHSNKKPYRYEKIFLNYKNHLKNNNLDYLIYIVKNDYIFNRMYKILSNIGNKRHISFKLETKKKILFIDYDTFINDIINNKKIIFKTIQSNKSVNNNQNDYFLNNKRQKIKPNPSFKALGFGLKEDSITKIDKHDNPYIVNSLLNQDKYNYKS